MTYTSRFALAALLLAACSPKEEADTTGEASTGATTGTTATPTTGDPTTTAPDTSTGVDPSATATATGDPDTGATDPDTTTDTPLPVRSATAENSCAPDDGAAVLLRVGLVDGVCGAEPAGDELRVTVFTGAPLPPGAYPIDGPNGQATLTRPQQEPVLATGGTITIAEWTDELVSGAYELQFADDTAEQGAFVGPLCPTMPMCG